MEWNLFTFQDILDRENDTTKYYTDKDYREYIVEHFKPSYTNNVFYNILLDKEYPESSVWKSKIDPSEQLEHFNKLYNTFTYHLQTDEITIFSYKHIYDNVDDEYSVFAYITNDFIIEFPRIKDLFKDKLCLPACAINWYKADGTRNYADYMRFIDNETEIWKQFINDSKEIIPPKDDKNCNSFEWWCDRREYYSFYKLKIHKYGKPCRVFEKHIYDCFADYTFTLTDMCKYFQERVVE